MTVASCKVHIDDLWGDMVQLYMYTFLSFYHLCFLMAIIVHILLTYLTYL